MIHPVDFHLHTHVRLLVTSWYCWVVALDSAAVASFSIQITMCGVYLVCVCVCFFFLGLKYFICTNKALITMNPIKYN